MSDLSELATEAYVFGYPLVFDLSEVQHVGRVGMGSLAPSLPNTFAHASKLAGPDDPFVSVNNDTVYSIAQLDLSGGPLLLHVPDTGGAYDVLQFVDAWTNNFAYVGRRATGTAEQRYAITPPGWSGSLPDGHVRISAPTHVATIVGRFACDGPDDLPRVGALQADLTLQPLGDGTLAGIPEPGDDIAEALRFWEQLRLWTRAFPPAPDDQAYARRFASLGLLGDAPLTALDTATTAALAEGLAAGEDRVEQATRSGQVTAVDGWLVGLHAFDYNLDHFEVGAIDDPRWKIADRTASYLARAVAARVGLWGNHAYEAVYAQVFTDVAGEPLEGSRRYAIRFEELPPVDGFWSLTMYDVPDYYLVDNAIDRYSIGDRTTGLRYAEDGSLTLLVQHDPPADEQRANWLPAPAGAFRPLMRLYEPKAAVLDGDYHLPPLVRVDGALTR